MTLKTNNWSSDNLTPVHCTLHSCIFSNLNGLLSKPSFCAAPPKGILKSRHQGDQAILISCIVNGHGKKISVRILVVSLAFQPVNKNLHHLRSVTATPFRKNIAQHKWYIFSVTRQSGSDVSYLLTDLL